MHHPRLCNGKINRDAIQSIELTISGLGEAQIIEGVHSYIFPTQLIGFLHMNSKTERQKHMNVLVYNLPLNKENGCKMDLLCKAYIKGPTINDRGWWDGNHFYSFLRNKCLGYILVHSAGRSRMYS